jgi:uncharacterized protein YciI
MPHQLLLYEYVDDILTRRAPHREAHLAAIERERSAGRLVLAGAYGDPTRGAAFVFSGVDADHVRRFVQEDPYVVAGLVTDWRVEPYNAVVLPAAH